MATLHTSSANETVSSESPETLVARLARAGRAAQVQLAKRLADNSYTHTQQAFSCK